MPGRSKSDDGEGSDPQHSFLEAPVADMSDIAAACAIAFATAAPMRCPTTSCWSSCCFARWRVDTKGLAKRLIERFGSFAEVINAPEPRLKEVQDVGEAVITELKLVRAARFVSCARRS